MVVPLGVVYVSAICCSSCDGVCGTGCVLYLRGLVESDKVMSFDCGCD